MSPNKILITGIVASGKTTLARKLSQETGLPLYELDTIAHPILKSDYGRLHEEQKEVLESINEKGQWILEGTDRKYQRYLFDWADHIIFLDPPLQIRKRRILTRFIKQIFLLEQCRYKPSLKMLRLMFKWTEDFERERGEFESFLRGYGEKVRYVDTTGKKKMVQIITNIIYLKN